jgi:hypothetical protein
MTKLGKRQHRLSDGYSFAGFRAQTTVRGMFGDPNVRIVKLDLRSKKPSAMAAVGSRQGGTTGGRGGFAIYQAPGSASSWNSRSGAWRAAPAAP